MRQLTKTESFLFLFGGLLMVAGAGMYAFFLYQSVVCWIMLAGAVLFATMQMRQRYDGTSLTIRRLRRIMTAADVAFVLSGCFMVEDSWHILQPFIAQSLGGYTAYVNIFHHNWVVLLLIAAILEMYTTHRIGYELKKEERA
ncbi:hypothetical protein [Prevotella dentasini]|uniref:hypothetical protein n=1 Tax=Prevotella dentasini TaxID=589537 RepID=UPI000469EB76|nr:hypothetical protein [Prevotella dentasini]